jgi:hypothetical protein
MTTLQKILQGILHIENESKQNYEKKTNNQRVTLIQLPTLKSLNNKNNYMAGITTYLSILTLNVNGLNSIKRHHLAN